jgi:non-heme chloroperoxidase
LVHGTGLTAQWIPGAIVHGAHDRILLIDSTARPFRKFLPHAHYVEIQGAPHGMLWTYAGEATEVLLRFLNS